MFGIRYLKVAPTTHVLHYRGGELKREGAGLSFFYYGPTSVIMTVPVGSQDVPFVFEEVTSDFQDATIQGELTYRITDPKRIAALLDFSLDAHGRHQSDDPGKLDERLIHACQMLARSFTQQRPLGEVLTASEPLAAHVRAGLAESEPVQMLGIEVLSVSIMSIKASPEMAKALQANAREALLRRADEAVYARRNAAVELERQIKENELNTEIAVEQKRRQVRETQMQASIAVEQQRTELVEQRVANERKEAEARGDALRATLTPLRDVDWRVLMAVSAGKLDAKNLIAMAFRDLADNAGKIGSLNITPDLLQSLMSDDGGGQPAAKGGRRGKE